MAWDIEVVFAAPQKNSARKAKQLAKAMFRSFRMFVTNVECSDLSRGGDAGHGEFRLLKISLKLSYAFVSAAAEQPLKEEIFRRLVVMGVAKGFTPLDDESDVIYVLEPYGFLAFYVNMAKGKGKKLQEVVNQVASEVDTPTYGIVKYLPEASSCYDFYKVSMNFTDYRDHEERKRLMLAVFYRITMLAKQQGFLVFQVPEKGDEGKLIPDAAEGFTNILCCALVELSNDYGSVGSGC